MAKQVINVGSSANDGTGDKNRVAFQKINSNFDELYDGDGAGTLQQVTDNGNTTTNDITAAGFLSLGNANIPGINFNDAEDLDTSLGFLGADPSITTTRNWVLPDASGTIALTSNIPTVDATPTDGSSNAVSSNGVFDALANKVDANATITGATKTKITYDSKGLVTSGADATTADISDSTNKRYVTDAQLVVIGNTSGTNSGDNATNSQYSGLATSKQDVLTDVNFGAFMNARTAKNTLVDADEVVSDDSADSNKAKKTTWLNVWTNYLKPKADALYQAILTDVTFGTFSTALTDKTTPVDADTVNLVDSADSNKAKKLSFANLKAWIQSFVPTVITSETGIYYFNDFLGVFTTSTNDGNISSDGNVAQTTTAPNSDANKQGFANVNTSTATAGYGNIYIGHTATANFILGGGVTIYETLIWLPNLSTSGERFSCLIGFSSGVLNQNNSSNNIAFLYDEGNIAFAGAGGASANWRAVTTDTAVRTFNDTGVAVNAGAFIKLRIVVNANASSVEFFIDNTLVATHTTNIPSGNTKRLSVRNYIQKSVGSTQRQLILDYIKLQQTFTTAR